MKTSSKYTSGIVSVAAIGAIAFGALTFTPALAEPTPEPTVAATPVLFMPAEPVNGLAAESEAEAAAVVAEAARVEAERVAAEQAAAAEAARIEAERVAAEQAAAEQAERDRVEVSVEIAPRAEQRSEPAPAPEPVRCPGGSTADESDGFNDTRCMPLFANNGGSCFEGSNYESGGCEPFRP